jgi:hypothetical protein
MDSSGRAAFAAVAAAATAAVIAASVLAFRRSQLLAEASSKEEKENLRRICLSRPGGELPEGDMGVMWVDEEGFEVLSAICDAFLPSLAPESLTEDAVASAMDSLHLEMSTQGALAPQVCVCVYVCMCVYVGHRIQYIGLVCM